MNFDAFTGPLKELGNCSLCPRNCQTDRLSGRLGWCNSDVSFNIGSICIHRGEEPAISGTDGICNIFFTNCNLQCIYCQNHQISDNQASRTGYRMEIGEVIRQVTTILDQGINRVGFVSPSHFIPHVKVIISIIQSLGYKPVWVYNTNGYDKAETLMTLEGVIDVFLPDLKYLDPEIARKYSGAHDYPEFAKKALKEMYRQKGAALITDEDDTAVSGIIVRHLVLPGQVANSLAVLRFLAGELSPRIHVSLMAQYYPTKQVKNHPQLGRGVTKAEYRQVTEEMEKCGLFNGWIQEFESSEFYRPDFNNTHPFE
ncbi:MAG: radical SAM protein [Bacteroidales bacterium]|nr:radical SAM protein [Bacteroidales bacterium]